MSFSRYTTLFGPESGTKTMSEINSIIRANIITGNIESEVIILEENRRLDQIAGQVYGNASYWWIIAAASGIGWGLQLPEGTLITIPKDLSSVLSLVL